MGTEKEEAPADAAFRPVPSVVEVIEAALFVGQGAMDAAGFCRAFPGVTADEFEQAIQDLCERYRLEGRPYDVRHSEEGYVLELKDPYRTELVQRLMGQRQIKLSRSVVDVLSVVAYRQPITKEGVDEVVGLDSGSALRQLIRRGLLLSGPSPADESVSAYSTAPRFLEIFGLESMDDIPSSDELDRPEF
jgi:segregation and condensation protein B